MIKRFKSFKPMMAIVLVLVLTFCVSAPVQAYEMSEASTNMSNVLDITEEETAAEVARVRNIEGNLIVTFFTNAAVNEKGQHSAYLKAVVQYQYGSSSVAFWDFELAF